MNQCLNIKQLLIIIFSIILNFIIILVLPYECSIKEVFGIDCVGCGATRMFKSLIKLEFYQAFRYNPFIFSLLVLVILYIIYVLICLIMRKKIYKPNLKFFIILFIIAIIFMILRNISIFSFLKPTIVK